MGRAIAIALARRGANVAIGSYTRKNENDISHPENIDTYLPSSRELGETVDELKVKRSQYSTKANTAQQRQATLNKASKGKQSTHSEAKQSLT